jgi:hypothetical protein
MGIQPKRLDSDPYQMNRVRIRNTESETRKGGSKKTVDLTVQLLFKCLKN